MRTAAKSQTLSQQRKAQKERKAWREVIEHNWHMRSNPFCRDLIEVAIREMRALS